MTEMVNQALLQSPGVSVKRLCAALELSRAEYYRQARSCAVGDQDLAVRQAIQQIVAKMPAYGYRRITAQLAREGIVANHKRVLKLMRKDGLLCSTKAALRWHKSPSLRINFNTRL